MWTIRVSDDVKERLRDLKRDGESFNDLLDRLSRTKKDVEQIAESLPSVDEEERADGQSAESIEYIAGEPPIDERLALRAQGRATLDALGGTSQETNQTVERESPDRDVF